MRIKKEINKFLRSIDLIHYSRNPKWKKVDEREVPSWVHKKLYHNPNRQFLKGKNYLYKAYDTSYEQGSHRWKIYKKRRIK